MGKREVDMSKYDGLAAWLSGQQRSSFSLSFGDLDSLVSGLPASARTDRTWWGKTANPTRVQARAWLGVGWRVEFVDLINERVTLVRNESRKSRG